MKKYFVPHLALLGIWNSTVTIYQLWKDWTDRILNTLWPNFFLCGYRKKMFVSAIILFLISTAFEFVVYRYVGHVKLFDDEDSDEPSPENSNRAAQTLYGVFSSRLSRRGNSATDEVGNTKAPSILQQTFRRISQTSSALSGRVFGSRKEDEGKNDVDTRRSSGSQSTDSISMAESQASTLAADEVVNHTNGEK